MASELIAAPHARLVHYEDLAPTYGIKLSRTHLARLERAGRFPKRFNPTPARFAWFAHEIESWLRERGEQRGLPAARLIRGAAMSGSA